MCMRESNRFMRIIQPGALHLCNRRAEHEVDPGITARCKFHALLCARCRTLILMYTADHSGVLATPTDGIEEDGHVGNTVVEEQRES